MQLKTPIALIGLSALLLTACGSANPQTDDLVRTLQTRIDELEQEVEQQASDVMAHGNAEFDVAMAQYVMDTAGFHGMDETLNETKEVDPAFLSTVTRVRKVLEATPWPAELEEQATAFTAMLEEFETALDNDDGEAAAGIAADVHEAQHELSHAIDDWLGMGAHEDEDHHEGTETP